ncbi:MAG: hypothetical protein ACREDM_17420 [Methylocella sp.]
MPLMREEPPKGLAAARVLPGCCSGPGGEAAPRLEHTRVWRAGGDRRGGDFSDPSRRALSLRRSHASAAARNACLLARNAGQQSADRALRMGARDPCVEFGDLCADRLQMSGKNLQGRLGDVWKRRIRRGLSVRLETC